MESNHLRQFSDWFDVLAVTHSKAFPNEDIRNRAKAEYFDVLRPYPIEAVSSSYETLRRKMKKWPVPADWLEALPPFGSTGQLPLATADEIRENREAEALGYEQPNVCKCAACLGADVYMPPRYVPRMYQGKPIERRDPDRPGRPLLLGEWIHGSRLKVWYAERARFYELKEKFEAEDKAAKAMTPTFGERLDKLAQRAKVLTVTT